MIEYRFYWERLTGLSTNSGRNTEILTKYWLKNLTKLVWHVQDLSRLYSCRFTVDMEQNWLSSGGCFVYPPTWRPCHTLWVALWNRIRHPQSIVTGDKDTRHISKYFAMAGPKQRELIFFIRPGTLSICGGLAVPLNESESCVPDPCVLWTPMFLNSPSSMFFLVTSWAYRINIYASAYIGYVGMD